MKILISAILLLIPFYSLAKEQATVYELSKLISESLDSICSNQLPNQNYYCRSVQASAINNYLRFCESLIEGTKYSVVDNPEACRNATMKQYDDWVSNQIDELHQEIENAKQVVWPSQTGRKNEGKFD